MYVSYDIGTDRISCLETEGDKKLVHVPGFGYEAWYYSSPSYVDTLTDNGFGMLIPQISARHEVRSRPITIDDHVSILSEFIEEASSQHDLSLLYLSGHSFGGTIALEYADRNPENIRGVIAMNACLPIKHARWRHIYNYSMLLLDGILGKEDNMRDKLFPYMDNLIRLGTDAIKILDEIVDYSIGTSPLDVPAVDVHSRNDRLYAMTDDISRQFAQKRVEVIEVDAGHNWCISHPSQAANLIVELFSGI